MTEEAVQTEVAASSVVNVKFTPPDALTPNRVFVYGTLKSGFQNHHYIGGGSKWVGYSRLFGYYLFHLGSFPAVIKAENDFWVVEGEVWDVTDSTLNALDSLEGHPKFYERIKVELQYCGSTWVYVHPVSYLHEGKAFIPSGRWTGSDQQAFLWKKDLQLGQQYTPTMISLPRRSGYSVPPGGPIVDVRRQLPRQTDKEAPHTETKQQEVRVGPGFEEVG